MDSYKVSIEIALLVFPFVAFLLTIPFLIHQYRKYGAIPFLKSVIFYSLVLYLIAAYFMVILPLPDKDLVSKLKPITPQLIPFNFIGDMHITTFKIKTIKDLLVFLNKPTVYTVLFNFLLTMPFGFYLRYFFKKKWYHTIILTFLLSLFFEVSQLTGLYGYYPQAYRIFDVDDLIINTTGGLLGHIFAPLLMIFLPSRDKLEEMSYLKGKKVTLLRRVLSFLIDVMVVVVIDLIMRVILYNTLLEKFSLLVSISFYFVVIPLISKGQTLGKRLLRIKIGGISKEITWYKLLIRNIILVYLVLFPFLFISLVEYNFHFKLNSIFKIVIFSFQIVNILYYLGSFFRKENIFLYEKITNTKNVSTIVVDNTLDNLEVSTEKVDKNNLKDKKIREGVKKDKNND